ncbi:MAG: UDP-N-acetylmuramoyl-tripeptide--D-alanyl-D-alanine ligase [Clostridiales bacterium]|nr:UDP-N-acetylmuramoyl-tripeptide--D-alanyl-D-alanine ligase [Clostridiales bacterium]
MLIWQAIVMCVVSGLLLTGISLKLMQMLQLSSYRAGGIFAWLKRTKFDYAVRYFALAFFCFTSMFVYVMCFGKLEWYSLIGYLFFVILCLYFISSVRNEAKKTPLKFTKRIVRLLVVDFILNSGMAFVLIWLLKDTTLIYSLLGISPLLCLITLLLAHYILLPIEKLIGRSFVVKASKKLNKSSPIVIGITGSYGKTTAKNVLSRFLMTKYKVFASPGSYNTPMGLSKCINEEYKGEQVFIAEMGARYPGDITYLKKVFKPQYAVLTAIGNQHLETFKTKENIIKEKTAILDGVKFAVANGDCADVVDNVNGRAVLCGKVGDATYSDVKTSLLGTDFVLTIGENKVDIHTRLVGDHVPVTIAMCALMAYKLGVDLDDIKETAEKLPFVEHRLEVLNSGDIIILDDSYNSNPTGADNALRILDTYEGKKIVITPGFVELGADAEKCLKELGQKITSVCDYAFLLGPNAETIKSGMGDYEKVFIVGSLNEAMECLKEIEPPMAVLFENDLPDNY